MLDNICVLEDAPIQSRTSVEVSDKSPLPKPYFSYMQLDTGLWWKLKIYESKSDHSQWLRKARVAGGVLLGRRGKNEAVRRCFFHAGDGWNLVELPVHEAWDILDDGEVPPMRPWNGSELQMALLLYPDATAPQALYNLSLVYTAIDDEA